MLLLDYFTERLNACPCLLLDSVAESDEFMIKYRMRRAQDEVTLDTVRNNLLASRFSEELLDYEVNNTLTLLPKRLLIGEVNLYNAVMTIKLLYDNSFLVSIAIVSQIMLDDYGNEYSTWYKVDYAN